MFTSTFQAQMVKGAVLVTAPFPAVIVRVTIVVLSLLPPFTALLSLAFSLTLHLSDSLALTFLVSWLVARVVVEGQRAAVA